MKVTKPIGSLASKIAIIHEAVMPPGPTQTILDMKLHRAGISKSSCYITHLCPATISEFRAANAGVRTGKNQNDFTVFSKGSKPTEHLTQFRERLLDELEKVGANVFVALGAGSLWALTGEHELEKWRGSIFEATLPSGRTIKVIATYAPYMIAAVWKLNAILELDLIRVTKQGEFPEVIRPKRNLIIRPSESVIQDFCHSAKGKLMYDIETYPAGMSCISFAINKDEAISIPTTVKYWGSVAKLYEIMLHLHHALVKNENVTSTVAQNCCFDIQYLVRFYGILPKKVWNDTMVAQHACYPEMKKGLAFLASVYTEVPYYKDDLKVWNEDKTDDELLWTYNATDATTQYEVMEKLEVEMDVLNTRDVYNHMMLDTIEPLLFMMLKGVNFNEAVRIKHRGELLPKLDAAMVTIADEMGGLNPNSPKQVKEYMEGKGIKIPTRRGKETTDKKALAKLTVKDPLFAQIIDAREHRKLISTYIDMKVDAIDGRLRCSYNPTGAVTGRLSSSKSIFYCGANLQNQPKSVRDMIMPDTGLEFTEADLKGAEAMIVAYLAQEPMQIRIFESGGNIHSINAQMIFGVTEEEVKADKRKHHEAGTDTSSMYHMAKCTGHAANYMTSKVSLSEILRIPQRDAHKLLMQYYDSYPNIRQWHFKVKRELEAKRILITPLGRKRIFFGRMDDQTLREAVNYIPQETSAHALNLGLINVYNELCHTHNQIDLMITVHDSILLQHPPKLRGYVHKKLHELMSIPLTIHSRTFTIPIELSIGNNWKDMEDV